MEIAALESILDGYGIDSDLFPPGLVAAAVQGLAFAMAYDQTSGFETAHRESSEAMTHLLDHLEAQRAAHHAS